MPDTVFRIALLEAVRSLAPPKVIALGCGANFPDTEIERSITGMHLWLSDRLQKDFIDEDSSDLGDFTDSFMRRLYRFSELSEKRNENEVNTLKREELLEASEILIGLHKDYYERIPEYRKLVESF